MPRASTSSQGRCQSGIGTVAATGQPFILQGIEVFEIRDDRIVDVWQAWDMGPLYAALGARL